LCLRNHASAAFNPATQFSQRGDFGQALGFLGGIDSALKESPSKRITDHEEIHGRESLRVTSCPSWFDFASTLR
jgi:hypothetical protein